MKYLALTAIAASAMFVLSTSAFAQSARTDCEFGEGQILEYDFAKNLDGKVTLGSLHGLRLVSSNCVPGQPSKTMFRGVNVEFENATTTQNAISAVHALIMLGVTDQDVFKQLVDRVSGAMKQVQEQRPEVKYSATVLVSEKDALVVRQHIK